MRVAVVGAGAAGLVAARELSRANHDVAVYEQSMNLGGIWVYQEKSERDPLGQSGLRLHASMYKTLRTNLPRDVMAFFDFSFDSEGGGKDSWPRYPGHAEVLSYLQRFADAFDVERLISFNAKVLCVHRGDKWTLLIDSKKGRIEEKFDALAVCNGHYAEPRVPNIPGIKSFPGLMMHSHNYRARDSFTNKRVAVIGTAASGVDLTIEIAGVSESVYWCGNDQTERHEKIEHMRNVFACGPLTAVTKDGRLLTENSGYVGPIDCLIFATGYHYSFPFLSKDLISVNDNWVTPLYRDLLCVTQPTLALLGVPLKIIPFPIFEIQSRWFARLLNKEFELPVASTMFELQEERASKLGESGIHQRNFHVLENQFQYYDELAIECGEPVLPNWYRKLGEAAREHGKNFPGSFRDKFLDVHGAPTRYPEQ